jgi:hypothetical protein
VPEHVVGDRDPGVIDPAASELDRTFDSSSGGRWLASTSGVAWARTSLGAKMSFSRPDSIIRANQAWR